MKVITCSTFKGGAGKSTVTILLANTYAASGRSVLVVDLDHQRNTTRFYLDDLGASSTQNVSMLFARHPAIDAVLETNTPNISIIAGSFDILNYRADSPRLLTAALEPLKDLFDIVLIDCPPTYDGPVRNAWIAADVIVTPAQLDTFNLDGVAFFKERLEEESPEHITVWKILFNNNQRHRSENPDLIRAQIENAFRIDYSPWIAKSRLQRSQLFSDAVHNGKRITRAKNSAPAFDALVDVASELIGERIMILGGRI